ncbi:hypothetical protein PR202_ga22920 [Eleusine coracana subsp. coracana]|uniref:Serpin domain-containing protein n=1 Tax=Eleusine coracana subsp. coracana TaxID=191504 RepID=A0AAV5D565_ELECO|nr:hypothetical protein PR202_ga22920 [Eleusine coracana subsp. coracana]
MKEAAARRGKKVRPTDASDLTASPCKKARQPAAGSGLTKFAFHQAKKLSEGDAKGKNLVFLPLSIYAALALVAAGARGETLDEFLTVLGAASREELAEFVRDAAECALTYGTRKEASRKQINDWVSETTNKLITSILPEGSVHSWTALVVANCIYFKGK